MTDDEPYRRFPPRVLPVGGVNWVLLGALAATVAVWVVVVLGFWMLLD